MFKYKTIDIWKICCIYRIKTSIFQTLMEQIYKKKYKNNLTRTFVLQDGLEIQFNMRRRESKSLSSTRGGGLRRGAGAFRSKYKRLGNRPKPK